MKKRAFLIDVVVVVLLFYAWSWAGVWFNQAAMRDPYVLMPVTEFTEGHLAGTAVGIVELETGSFWDLYVDDIGWPDGLVYRPLMWPSIVLGYFVGPVMSLNLLWSYALPFNAICGYFLLRVLRRSRVAAVVAGSLVAWNPWVRETLSNGQFEQAYIGVIALIWGAVLLAERRPWLGGGLLFFVVLLSGLAVPNCALTGLVALPLMGVWRVLGRWRRLPAWVLCAFAAGGAGVLVSGYQSYNFEDTAPQFFSPRRADDSSMQSVATLSSLWNAPSVSVASNQVVHCTYLGRVWPIAGMGGALLGGPVGWMSLVVDAGLIHLSLGPSVDVGEDTYYLPVAWVQDSIPVLSQSGSYYRFVMGSFVAFALGVGAGLNTISRYSTFLAVGMGGLLIRNAWVETEEMKGHPIPLTAQTAFSSPEIAKLRGGEGAVLGLPLLKNMGCDKGSFGYVKEYWLHRRPILHSMEPPVRYRSNEPKIGRLQRAFTSADCAKKMPAVLSSLNVGSLIVQLNARCPLSTEQLRCLEDAFGSATRGKGVLLWETLN